MKRIKIIKHVHLRLHMPFIIAQNFFLSPKAFYHQLFQLYLAKDQALIEVSTLNTFSLNEIKLLLFWLSVDKYNIY
jgi:hypothetical protein